MNRKLLILLFLCVAVLAGCGTDRTETTAPPSTSPATTVPETTIPETTVPETTVPETTVPPTTEPEMLLEAGPGVTADGDTLPSGTVLSEDTPYMNLSEFLFGFDNADYTGDDLLGYTLRWNGLEFSFLPDQPSILMDGVPAEMENPIMIYQQSIWIPVQETCQLMGISYLEDQSQNHLYCTSVGQGWDWAKGIKIPILMYHGVTDDTWGAAELFVRPKNLEKQIEYLLENGYDLITFEDWSHLEDFDKPVMLTFDDGYADNCLELFPILQKYHVKATIFLITCTIDKDPRSLSSLQIRQMQDSGLVSFQSHTYSHPYLAECDHKSVENEMLWSKIHIARHTGYEPFVLCYPYGSFSKSVRSAAMEHYRFALAMNGGLYTTGNDVSQITRYYVSRDTGLSSFANMVSGK